MNKEIRGLALLMEDNAKVGKTHRYQHIFSHEANGVWSVLSDSAVPPYRKSFRATVMEVIDEDSMRRIVLA